MESYIAHLLKFVFQFGSGLFKGENWQVVCWSSDEVITQKLIQILNSHAWVWVHHGYQQLLQALGDLVLPVQHSGVWVIFEEIGVPWLQFQVLEVCVLWSSRVEWRCTKSQHEKKCSQRENICGLSDTRHLSSIVNLWSHVVLCAHLFRYESISPSRKSKVAELQMTIFRDQDIVKLYVQMSITCFV